MSNKYKYPFGIDFVVEQDLVPLGIVKIPNPKGFNINCPFCEQRGLKPDKHHKYAIDRYKNVGHCMRCGAGHGITGLHQALTGLTLDEAKEDLKKRWAGLPSEAQVELKNSLKNLEEENKRQLYPAPIEIRDEVYRRFLSQLTLSKRHRIDLIARGLTEQEIIDGMYKTVPACGFVSFAKNSFTYEIKDTLKRHIQWGIPGFYDIRTDEPKVVKCDPGFFVPVRNEDNLISGMQIRYDPLPANASPEKKEHYAKYKWFVSNYKERKDGCTASGCENIHYATHLMHVPNTITLTEGVLKADIASRLRGRIGDENGNPLPPAPVLGLVGVYNTEGLGMELQKLKDWGTGLKNVVIAVDMDYREKPQVAAAMQKIEKIVSDVGLQYTVFKWDPQYKGIDDYYLAKLKHNQGK